MPCIDPEVRLISRRPRHPAARLHGRGAAGRSVFRVRGEHSAGAAASGASPASWRPAAMRVLTAAGNLGMNFDFMPGSVKYGYFVVVG